jgi:DNA-directed RNA polymerase subunit E'/Rpb7
MNVNLHTVLEPQFFDKDVKRHIFETTKRIYENTSIKQIGYIIKITRLNHIYNTYIDKSSYNIIVEANYNIDVCNPTVDDVIRDCKIHLIMNHGIFLKHYKIDILIPSSQLSDYYYDTVKQTFIHKKTKMNISKGDLIDVKIIDRRFNQNEFSCIAKINI